MGIKATRAKFYGNIAGAIQERFVPENAVENNGMLQGAIQIRIVPKVIKHITHSIAGGINIYPPCLLYSCYKVLYNCYTKAKVMLFKARLVYSSQNNDCAEN